MGSSAPPISFQAPQQQLRPQAVEAKPSESQSVAKSAMSEFEASMRELASTNLVISYDEDAGRFVQTLTDANTSETLRRYPNDTQLAYSRAVVAYMRALAEAVNKT